MYGLSQYRSYQVDTAGPEERVVLLYDGARRFVDQARTALAHGRYDQLSANAGKAMLILEELSASLDMRYGEIPQNLSRLYEYWIWRLTHGHLKRDDAALAEVSGALSEFHEVWAEVARQVRAQRPAQIHS